MKQILFIVTATALAFAGCQAGFIPDGGEGLTSQTINDVLRDAEFDYSTMVPVGVTLSVNLSDGTATRSITGGTLATVRVENASGELLFAAGAESGETVAGEILVPVDSDPLTIEIAASGHATFSVAVDDPQRYLMLDRTVSLAESSATGDYTDTDGDGIIDSYDAEPLNPEVAFVRSIPVGGALTVAFEDNYPELGDGDYNDFVTTYSLTEYRSSRNKLVKVRGQAQALARGAGFEHEFGLALRFDGLDAAGTVIYDARSGLSDLQVSGSDLVVLPLFPATREAFERTGAGDTMDNVKLAGETSIGHVTNFTVTYTASSRKPSADIWKPYDPYLRVFHPDGPDVDVHLIGQPPLPDSENHLLDPAPASGFRDENGFPRALLVPGSWQWPLEHSADSPVIEQAYPEFAAWRASLGTTHTDWYLRPNSGQVFLRD